MSACRFWCVLCALGSVSAARSANTLEYEGNYADNYDNEISPDQQEGDPPTPCQAAEFSRWDRLFIALEDSHMRQNMLLESLETCCGRAASDPRTAASCQQCGSSVEAACRRQAEQAALGLQQSLARLRDEAAERERRFNDTVKALLRGLHAGGAPEDGGPGRRTPPGPDGDVVFMAKPFPSGQKEQQEVTSPRDVAPVEKALVAIATELQTVHVRLSKVIEQVGTMRKDREI